MKYNKIVPEMSTAAAMKDRKGIVQLNTLKITLLHSQFLLPVICVQIIFQYIFVCNFDLNIITYDGKKN